MTDIKQLLPYGVYQSLTTANSSTLLGRFSVGTGMVEEITLGAGLSLSVGGVLSATGGGGLTTASNGLTVAGSDVKLGGTLTGNTLIDGAFDFKLGSVTPLTNFSVYTDAPSVLSGSLVMSNTGIEITATNATPAIPNPVGSTASLTLIPNGLFGPYAKLATTTAYVELDSIGGINIQSGGVVEIGATSVRMAYLGPNKLMATAGGPGGGIIAATIGTGISFTSGTLAISASYLGQTSITTLGTITTGTWSTGAIIGGATMTLGADATGDIYYRNAGGVLTRLGIGTAGQVLTVAGGLPSWATPSGGTGTVTSVSVVSANGFAGTVATATTTPAITLTTTVTGVLKGDGTAISAATDADITGKLLTGYVSGAGTISATDSILTAIQKLNGNISALPSVRNITAADTFTSTDSTIEATGAVAYNVTLPTAVGISGKIYVLKNTSGATKTLDTTGGQLIDGATSRAITATNSITVQSNGTNWIIIG